MSKCLRARFNTEGKGQTGKHTSNFDGLLTASETICQASHIFGRSKDSTF